MPSSSIANSSRRWVAPFVPEPLSDGHYFTWLDLLSEIRAADRYGRNRVGVYVIRDVNGNVVYVGGAFKDPVLFRLSRYMPDSPTFAGSRHWNRAASSDKYDRIARVAHWFQVAYCEDAIEAFRNECYRAHEFDPPHNRNHPRASEALGVPHGTRCTISDCHTLEFGSSKRH